ncbi:ATP-binding protein [Hyalangium gracile]|uniref:ATP-binding protein n=1 Tax=Hyalangium gracile TaxID=394092 RepID=UPI001CC935C2|nr:AAA family ATPase [Hyalangium gracile]
MTVMFDEDGEGTASAGPASSRSSPQMPYSAIVGQAELKRALELCFVERRIGGVLLSGERGTGKTTAVRAFARMAMGGKQQPMVNLPINATEDRVVGGWQIKELIEGRTVFQPGLLEEANGGLLYVDEVNLLDDHIVNIILDVTSTGMLVVQREGLNQTKHLQFVLVGTMNPEEGTLRPQLLDRFGLMVAVQAETEPEVRARILEQVLGMEDEALRSKAEQQDSACRERLLKAQERLPQVQLPRKLAEACVRAAQALVVEGHRAELVLARAARAMAALEGRNVVSVEDIRKVAPLALAHRRKSGAQRDAAVWSKTDDTLVDKALELAPGSA